MKEQLDPQNSILESSILFCQNELFTIYNYKYIKYH